MHKSNRGRKILSTPAVSLSNQSKGFTLIEVVLVLGLLGMIFALTSFSSFDEYRGSSFRGDRDAFVAVLQRARSQAINGICFGSCTGSVPHGVHITSTSITLFQGVNYPSRDIAVDEVIEVGANLNIKPGGFTDVVFAPLSGDAATTPSAISTITFMDPTFHTSDISIGSFGQITWTN